MVEDEHESPATCPLVEICYLSRLHAHGTLVATAARRSRVQSRYRTGVYAVCDGWSPGCLSQVCTHESGQSHRQVAKAYRQSSERQLPVQ